MWTNSSRPLTKREMFFRTRVIVRLGLKNRMVTKGYRKGVYEWVTCGTSMDSELG
jgi:hypothetical protein